MGTGAEVVAFVEFAALVAGGVATVDALSGGDLLTGESPSAPVLGQPEAEKQAANIKRRALAKGGRQSTLLVDESDGGSVAKIPGHQIGGKSFLGG